MQATCHITTAQQSCMHRQTLHARLISLRAAKHSATAWLGSSSCTLLVTCRSKCVAERKARSCHAHTHPSAPRTATRRHAVMHPGRDFEWRMPRTMGHASTPAHAHGRDEWGGSWASGALHAASASGCAPARRTCRRARQYSLPTSAPSCATPSSSAACRVAVDITPPSSSSPAWRLCAGVLLAEPAAS